MRCFGDARRRDAGNNMKWIQEMKVPAKEEERKAEAEDSGVVRRNMWAIGMSGEDAEDGERWKRMIHCCDL